jgi:serine/threonine protein kinase/tetratricopeptide (TPR) repeat protein
MPADNWDRVEALFLRAADLAPDEQALFLDTMCASDTELRAEVESLLESDRKGGLEIAQAVRSEAAALLDDESQPLIGARLGPYRVIREIGRGGMGSVYLATRDDDQYQKQVAIKVVKRGMDTADVLGRFRHERQILANLDHPYIARLLDGGTTADGRPFFVMDYVEGVSVDVFCATHGLNVQERCRLFLRICEAVSHAHRNLVVHRDLKPGNIFVTADGTPKLLDFGVAKLLSADEANTTATMLMRPFTPEYASPEQVRGMTATTTTDVYSLGAILYELLTCERAQPITATTPLEIDRAVCEIEVSRPSLKAPGLDADLDNIVLMAMRKEPQRRYQSVDQLAEDIRRHLDGRPVLARQDSFSYRSRKFLRRNRTAVGAGLLLVTVLIAGATAAALEARRANRERAAANRRFEQVRQLAGKFLLDFHDAIASLPGSTAARKMVVETGLQYYDTLVKEAQGNRDLLEEIARGYDRLGDVQGNPYYANLGDSAGAMASYRKSLAIRERLTDDSPEFLRDRMGGRVKLAQMLGLMKDPVGADKMLRETIALGEHSPSAQSRLAREAIANAYRADGDVQFRVGNFERAVAPFTKLLEMWTQMSAEKHDVTQERTGLAVAHAKLADSLVRTRRANEALTHVRIAVAIDQDLAAADRNSLPRMRKLYIDYTLLCLVFRVDPNLAAPGEARGAAEKTAELAETMAAADPKNNTALFDLMTAQTLVGDWFRSNHDAKSAVTHYRRAVEAIEKFAATNPAAQLTDDSLIFAHQRLASGLGLSGELEEALAHCRKAEEYLARADQRSPGLEQMLSRRFDVVSTRAEAYAHSKRWPEAITAFQESFTLLDELRRRDPKSESYVNDQVGNGMELADCYASAGRRAEARKSMESAMAALGEMASRRPLTAEEDRKRREGAAKLTEWGNRWPH